MDLGVKIHGCPKIIRFTLVYPGVSTGRGSFRWWERPCSPCAETPETASAAWRCAAVSVGEDRMTMARGHSRCRLVQLYEVQSGILWYFYRCSILSSSTGSMDIGAPDRSSRFQWMLYVAFPSSKFPWSSRVVISGASLSWSTQHVLLKHPVLEFIHIFDICRGDSSWTPMSQCEEWEKWWEMFLRIESSLVKFSNANIDQFISILCIEGCQFGCQQCSGNAPVDMVREERQTELVNLLMDRRLLAARVGLKHCSGPRMSTSTDITWWNFWRLWGWKPFSSGVR